MILFLSDQNPSCPHRRLEATDGLYHHLMLGTLYVPKGAGPTGDRLRQLLIKECHSSAMSGHFGVDKVTALLQRDYFWPRMRRTVRAYIQSCHECQLCKPSHQKPYGLLHPLPIPDRCWQHVTMDMITALPPSPSGNDAVVVFVDRLSKLCHFAPCKKTITASGMADLLLREVIRHHGWPEAIISDRDPRFDADFWRALLDGSGTQLRMSTPYHPQTDGQTERANRTLLQMLRAFIKSVSGVEWES